MVTTVTHVRTGCVRVASLGPLREFSHNPHGDRRRPARLQKRKLRLCGRPPKQGEREKSTGEATWPRGVVSGMGWSQQHPPAGPVEGDTVIFHKHYLSCFVGDKVFAKLCWKSRTVHVTGTGTATCSDWLRGPPAGLTQNTGTSKWVYLV